MEKRKYIVKESLDKHENKTDYFILCGNLENNENMYDSSKNSIILLKDGNNYNIIVKIYKELEKPLEFLQEKANQKQATLIIGGDYYIAAEALIDSPPSSMKELKNE